MARVTPWLQQCTSSSGTIKPDKSGGKEQFKRKKGKSHHIVFSPCSSGKNQLEFWHNSSSSIASKLLNKSRHACKSVHYFLSKVWCMRISGTTFSLAFAWFSPLIKVGWYMSSKYIFNRNSLAAYQTDFVARLKKLEVVSSGQCSGMLHVSIIFKK